MTWRGTASADPLISSQQRGLLQRPSETLQAQFVYRHTTVADHFLRIQAYLEQAFHKWPQTVRHEWKLSRSA